MICAKSEVGAFEQLLASAEGAEVLLTRISEGRFWESCRGYTAPRSINRLLTTLSLLVHAAHLRGILPRRMQPIPRLRVGDGDQGSAFGLSDIVRVVDYAKLDDSKIGRRVYAILWLSLDLYLTLEALRELSIQDLDLPNARIRILIGRERAFVWREMATATVSALLRWLEVRKAWGDECQSPVFTNVIEPHTANRLSTLQIGLDIVRAFSRVRLKGGHRTLVSVSRRESVLNEFAVSLLAKSGVGRTPKNAQTTSELVALERRFARLVVEDRARMFLGNVDGNGSSTCAGPISLP